MRRPARLLLLLCAFAIPWEYSLDFGAPLGNVARIAGLLTLIATVAAVLLAGGFRTLSRLHWLVMGLFLWCSASLFWSSDAAVTLNKLPDYLQEMMIAWLVWELAESLDDLRALLRAWVAGSWMLAGLTLASLASVDAVVSGQSRFVAAGQNANDVARFLDLGFPLAGILLVLGERRIDRWLGLGYFPMGLAAVVITGSRGGAIAGLVALAGCTLLLFRMRRQFVFWGALCIPLLAVALWMFVPHETFNRIATILGQLQGGDLNQRTKIWFWGWDAFIERPCVGSGAGTFVIAAGVAPVDTAHNTALSIVVEEGLIGLGLASAILAECFWLIRQTKDALRIGFTTMLLVWCIASMVGTAAESRITWLMIGVFSVAWRISRNAEALKSQYTTDAVRAAPSLEAFITPLIGADLGRTG
ncbi:MAG TPA: O-antigen ligase family protein [Terracidiphilus sp.]|jgi:O-antigen ligase|nr:O-antigen ligase family protein [Terracidiphilus sp.]